MRSLNFLVHLFYFQFFRVCMRFKIQFKPTALITEIPCALKRGKKFPKIHLLFQVHNSSPFVAHHKLNRLCDWHRAPNKECPWIKCFSKCYMSHFPVITSALFPPIYPCTNLPIFSEKSHAWFERSGSEFPKFPKHSTSHFISHFYF